MAILTLMEGQLAYGHWPLLDQAELALEAGERVGLIGRNGSGKSSLLRVLAGLASLDDGVLQVQDGLRVAHVPQEPLAAGTDTVFDAVAGALAPVRRLIEAYSSGQGDLNALQGKIEAAGGWNWEQRVKETLERLQLDGARALAQLSGGARKRVALARALVTRPDLLLLDEPTNHLDLDAIQWLEQLLLNHSGTAVVITHDRAFLDRVATRIVELDRGRLRSYPGNFSSYRALKDEQLAQEATVAAKADKFLAQEEAWIRQGVQARRTRNEGRVRRLKALRNAHAQRREAQGQVRLAVDARVEGYQGKLVAELEQASFSWEQKTIVRGFSTTVLRGDKVGIVGPNGAGKTTLLRLLLGKLAPDAGQARQGRNLEVAYFDQLREALDPEATLEAFISPGGEWIEIGGRRQHVKSYLRDFLFAPERAHSPIRSLSGGERARLLLARLFARPANVLVLDEPTNDLDIETLELLEELLQDYDGTVFLVSHDRMFLDHVVTSIIASEGDGRWREYEGDTQDWLQQRERMRASAPARTAAAGAAQPAANAASARQAERRKKLSYREQREFDELPDRIDALEQEQNQIRATLADGSLYRTDVERAIALQARDTEIEAELETALERWEELGERA